MLAELSIRNYTIVAALDIELLPGMTVITGETGAGKSIMLDALGLCLGDRADAKSVRHGCERAEISARFAIRDIPQAAQWLSERDLLAGDDCLLRRVVTADGRSRAYINGSPGTLQDCAELGTILIDIHSQHAHQSLLRKAVQRELLDAYAGHGQLAHSVELVASQWLRKSRELAALTGAHEEHSSRAQLLAYQVEELDALDMRGGELAALEQERNQLANAEDILAGAHRSLQLCEEQESATGTALRLLDANMHNSGAAARARELLDSAVIALGEARDELRVHIDGVKINPERLSEVQQRLDSIYEVARKHRVMPEQLAAVHLSLREELQGLAGSGERIAGLQQEMAELARQYGIDSARLSKQRAVAAKKLVKKTTEVLASLAMAGCQFEIALTPLKQEHPHPTGGEDIEFLISTNPGTPPRPLGKIASGGELSRISLAIGVVTADTVTTPSMVFDEVDVGIGGAVAEVVGRLLRTLSERAQVLCVTHLAQVAAQGMHHLQVSKSSSGLAVEASLRKLEGDDRTQEIARMLGGVRITAQSLAHAREMLEG